MMEKPWSSQVIDDIFDEQEGDLLEAFFPFEARFEDEEDLLSWAEEKLPTAVCENSVISGCSLLTIVSYNHPSQKLDIFLFDLIRIWLLSDNLHLRSFTRRRFTLEKYPDQSFLMAKFLFETTREKDIEKINNHIPFILKEIALYLASPRQAEMLLKLSNAASKEEFYFHEAIIQLLHRWPDDLEKDLIQDYQHFLGISEKEFRNHRSMRHQLRLLSSLYVMRKRLMRKIPLAPQELHLEMRLLPTCLQFPFSCKQVIGIAIAISLPSPYERFEAHHILLAVQKLIPWSNAIKESFLAFQKPQTSLRLLYLEIEKTNDTPFSLTERALLKQQLNLELKKSVETLSPSIFGNCDAEEVMKSIYLLNKEPQVPHEIPQVMISFEGSSGKNLIFRIIAIRVVKKTSKPLVSYFQALEEEFEYVPEKSSVIGYLGKKTKEAAVFRLHIPKTSFLLRSDSSLNLYRARQHVYFLLTKALGEIRDYNGGIFAKQLELYSQFKRQFQKEDPELLEDFFHALNPPEMQAILPLSSITCLFQLFLKILSDSLPREESTLLHTQEKEDLLFAAVRLKDTSFQERLTHALIEAKVFHEINAWAAIKRYDGLVLGYIIRSHPKKNQLFIEILRQTLEKWSAERQNTNLLRLDIQNLPVSLDPRLGGDEVSAVFLKMLFEGLARIDQDGKPALAAAKSVTISNEGLRYTFTLRESFWNNGEPVTAHDFSYAWKKILSPSFTTPFAYLFYAIKNAKLAKEGKISLDEVGIYAPTDQTLIVELEHPCSYFLELTANPLYSPVNHRVDCVHPNWPLQTGKDYVCNGPFYLESMNSRKMYMLQKNAAYWDALAVGLNRIQIFQSTARKALEMYSKGEIDWLGRPSRPWELFFSQQCPRPIEKLSSSVASWCVCNVQHGPLHSVKLRLALAYALDRQAIIRSAQDRTPAFSPLPLIYAGRSAPFTSKQRKKAKILFEEALQELGVDRNKWPSLTLIHANNEVRRAMAEAIVSQWQDVLGITIYTEECDFRDLFTKMTKGNYQLGLMMWRNCVDDPLYTLNAFKDSTEEMNLSKWEDARYQQLLDQVIREMDLKKKKGLMNAAEAILIDQMPVIPIAYEAQLFSRAESIEGTVVSQNGNIDFKYVRIKKKPQNIEKITVYRS